MSDAEPMERAAKAAERKGLVVVEPGDCQLFVDIDDAASLQAFERNLEVLRTFEPLSHEQRPSPSGRAGRWHVVVTLCRPLRDPGERILLQALLGSDLQHEMLSYKSWVRDGNQTPTLFFERAAP